MLFPTPLVDGQLIRRYKRFFADVKLKDSSEIVAHVPNTGSLKGCLNPESPCRLSPVEDPRRQLKYTLQMVQAGTHWVGVNTHLSNHLVWEAYQENLISHWQTKTSGQREVKISPQSRIDLVLWDSDSHSPDPAQRLQSSDFEKFQFHFVEIKNVTLAERQVALFPDAVTSRGQKHLKELMTLIDRGHTAEIFFTVQREDCHSFSPAVDIDPEYARLLGSATGRGLKVTAMNCQLSKKGIRLDPSSSLKIII